MQNFVRFYSIEFEIGLSHAFGGGDKITAFLTKPYVAELHYCYFLLYICSVWISEQFRLIETGTSLS